MRAAVIDNGRVANVIEINDLATAFMVRVEQVVPGYVPPQPADDPFTGETLPLPPPPTETVWVLPEGIDVPQMVQSDTAQIGDVYVAGVFTTPEQIPTPPVVPKSLTPLQTRKVLRAHNLLAQVEAAVAQAGPAAVEAWEYANAIQRSDALVTALTAALGLTTAQVDALFIEGHAL